MLSKTREKVAIKGLVGFAGFLVTGYYLYLSSMSEALFPLMLISFAITSLAVGHDLIKNKNRLSLLTASFLGILSYATFHITTILPETLKPAELALLPLAGGFLVTAIGIILRLLAKSYTQRTSLVFLEWFSSSWVSFSLGAILTLYIAFIRSSLLKIIPTLVIGEWVTVVFAIFLAYMELRKTTLEVHPEPSFSLWQKHVQETKQETHADFDYLTYIQDLFVNSGKKELMLVYYALQLRDLGESESQILRKIQRLSEYQDKKIPFLAFPWTKKKTQKINREAREELLKKLVEEIS
jgi:uncharacterized membrane protein